MRATLMVLLVLPLLAGLAVADKPGYFPTPVPFDGSNIYTGEGTYYGPPTVTNSPGEDIGDTYYAYQTNGSTGNRICIDEFGGIHVAFMKGTAPADRPRYVYYNFKDENTGLWLGETAITSEDGTGFVTMDLTEGGEALACYHSADATPSYSAISIDLFRGFGIFEEFPIPNQDIEWIWPYVARNADGKIHVLCADYNSSPTQYGYTRSEDGGETWTSYQNAFATDILSGTICTSPVSSKTAIIWSQPNSIGGYDLFYVESATGDNWAWRDAINVTEFTPADSMSAYADLDGIYDYDDNLHILYQGQLSDEGGVYIIGDVMHWSADAGHSYVASSPENCAQSNYNGCICKLSLGVDPANGNILALWAELSDADVSAGGFSNGELYAAGSQDGGATWGGKVNLTNSPTPGCSPPDCDSDIYSSLAELVDGTLHIMYIDDNDPGAEWRPEGEWTLNDVLYLAVDEGELIPLSVDDDIDLPFDFALSQNYPNPFNANTVINVEGDFETGSLAIYDVTGRLVRDFAINDDNRSVTWDGTDFGGDTVASGTYFYSVKVDGFGTAGVKKMTLLK